MTATKKIETENKNVVTENKVDNKPEVKAEVKVESKPEVRVNLAKAEKKIDKKSVEVKPSVKVEVKTETKIKTQSAGAKIRAMFEKILTDGKITADVMKILTNVDETKKVLSIRYAFLKPITKNPNDRKINGHARYGTSIVEIKGEKFWLTNDLYAKQVEIFEKWTKTLYVEKKSEVKK